MDLLRTVVSEVQATPPTFFLCLPEAPKLSLSVLQKYVRMPKNLEVLLSISCSPRESLAFAEASTGPGLAVREGRGKMKTQAVISGSSWVAPSQPGDIYSQFLDGLSYP